MTTSKAITATSQRIKECCMCGDLGISYLIFRCKICQSRYQHKYCSNEYPAAKFYRLCNWCLSEKEESSQKTHNSVTSSSSRKSGTNDGDARSKRKNGAYGNQGGVKKDQGSLKKLPTNPIIVKKRSPDRLPALASRKRTTTSSGRGGSVDEEEEEEFRQMKPEDTASGGMIRKPALRNKLIRAYKLLDVISC